MARERYSKLTSAATIALLMGLLVGSIAQNVGATHMPADKVVAAGSTVQQVRPAPTGTLLLEARLKTSKPTDLILMVTAECSIITDVTTGPSTTGGATSSQEAEGRIRIWVVIDGKIVPINSVSSPPQDPADQPSGTDRDKVTFCNHVHRQEVADGESPTDGIDRLRTYHRTKDANGFNWLRLNMGAGPHTIQVFGELCLRNVGGAQCDPTETSTGPSGGVAGALADGYVGNRSLIVLPEKLANDATI